MGMGERLKSIRETNNLSQREVSYRLAISNGTLSNYERNYRDPDTDTLRKIAELYNVTTDYLLGLNDIPMTLDQKINFGRLKYKKKAATLDEQLENIRYFEEITKVLIGFNSPQIEQLRAYIKMIMEDLELKKTVEMLQNSMNQD